MINLTELVNLKGYTALIPSIGVGNVAQLAIDLIVATLKMKRIGSGFNEGCMPIFGPPAYQHDSENKTTSLELYVEKEKKIIIFQIRSPLVAVFNKKFYEEIVEFLRQHNVEKLFILTSSHAYEKHSHDSPKFEYLLNQKFRNIKLNLTNCDWKEFCGKKIFGGGNAQQLSDLCEEHNIPALILFKYVAEGDNSTDASHLVSELNRILPLFEKPTGTSVNLMIPSSWNFLFGNNVPELIF